MDDTEITDTPLPVGDSDEDLMRAAFTDLFGQEFHARDAVAWEFDPSWVDQPS